ncbi:MAG TPA: hypothetical protein VGZ25_13515 [Gemmataceae bacterium]|nr:hypothetical protein [Gemmataceae bacterium]
MSLAVFGVFHLKDANVGVQGRQRRTKDANTLAAFKQVTAAEPCG